MTVAKTVSSTNNVAALTPQSAPIGTVVKVGAAAVKTPAASTLLVNGRAIPIDVRSMSAAAIAQFINASGGGAFASIDANGLLVINNVGSLDGDMDLLTFLGLARL